MLAHSHGRLLQTVAVADRDEESSGVRSQLVVEEQRQLRALAHRKRKGALWIQIVVSLRDLEHRHGVNQPTQTDRASYQLHLHDVVHRSNAALAERALHGELKLEANAFGIRAKVATMDGDGRLAGWQSLPQPLPKLKDERALLSPTACRGR